MTQYFDELTASFAPRVLRWFENNGRHDLPWQQHNKPVADIYAVWLSEIMLQQTQVATVMAYFERFMRVLPTVQDLAAADWQVVADLWAGLGYYARARNLHAGAKQLVQFIQEHGTFPQSVAQWQAIKGVGRSTAGAIVAMGVGARGVICDGNVKRVLTRHQAIEGDIAKSATDKQLWALAEALTPERNSGHFAQAMMDLGATICTRTRPKCHLCPVADDCMAHHMGTPTAYPVKSKKASKPHRYSLVFALKYQRQTLWLCRQEARSSIWAGLWCLPLLQVNEPNHHDLLSHLPQYLTNQSALAQAQPTEQALFALLSTHLPVCQIHQDKTIKHTLTHFHWHLSLVNIEIDNKIAMQIEQLLSNFKGLWCWQESPKLAKPAAIDKLLA